ncbi:MAG TPA: hypothetical protein VJU82_13860 [Acidobacteriaceae bacterium]|nr:hypothetical protein [Acidobacteriaceae bacterium]
MEIPLAVSSSAPAATTYHARLRAVVVAVAMVSTALVIRALLFLVATQLHGWTPGAFAELRDGVSYLNLAQAMSGQVPLAALDPFDRRVFIGYPALIALLGWAGLSVTWAALLLNWLAAALTAPIAARLTRDQRVGWAMVVFTPSYLMYSTLAMSEATLIWCTLWGLWRWQNSRVRSAGFLLGLAGLIRPMACFAVLGMLAEGWRAKRSRQALTVSCLAALVVVAGLGLRQLWAGDALAHLGTYAHDRRAYGGHLLAWPFTSLISTPLHERVPIWKLGYVWGYVVLVLGACGLAVRERAAGMAVWIIGNTLFALCIGSVWGFEAFGRFVLPALLPILWAYRRWYPRSLIGWSALGGFSVALALVGLLRS